MSGAIFDTLERLGLTSEATREVYATRTRDVVPLTVFRDRQSGVIYIDAYYTGDKTYQTGAYEQEKIGTTGKPDFERLRDAERRAGGYRPFYVGRDIADFGCGAGGFLRRVSASCASCCGIELQSEHVDALNGDGIRCVTSLSKIEDESLDTIFLFHSLEHLAEPLSMLDAMKVKLKPGGAVVIEVPHAADFLLGTLDSSAFRDFTLWSQHLVLHTRGSLQAMLVHCGYRDIVIEGVQRYPVSNHLWWLAKGLPGGHKSALSLLDTDDLTEAYAAALARIDATDTLVAIAYK